MERQVDDLENELTRLLREAAEISVRLDRAKGTIQGVPHYSVIELRAHELGQQLSRMVQQRQMHTMVAQQAPRTACPGCGTSCQLHPIERAMKSIDGPVVLSELQGQCPQCRRAFFPPQGTAGLPHPPADADVGSEDGPNGRRNPVVQTRRHRDGRIGGHPRLRQDD